MNVDYLKVARRLLYVLFPKRIGVYGCLESDGHLANDGLSGRGWAVVPLCGDASGGRRRAERNGGGGRGSEKGGRCGSRSNLLLGTAPPRFCPALAAYFRLRPPRLGSSLRRTREHRYWRAPRCSLLVRCNNDGSRGGGGIVHAEMMPTCTFFVLRMNHPAAAAGSAAAGVALRPGECTRPRRAAPARGEREALAPLPPGRVLGGSATADAAAARPSRRRRDSQSGHIYRAQREEERRRRKLQAR